MLPDDFGTVVVTNAGTSTETRRLEGSTAGAGCAPRVALAGAVAFMTPMMPVTLYIAVRVVLVAAADCVSTSWLGVLASGGGWLLTCLCGFVFGATFVDGRAGDVAEKVSVVAKTAAEDDVVRRGVA